MKDAIGFITFISTTYGSGSLLFDLFVCAGSLIVLLTLLFGLRLSAMARTSETAEFDQIQASVDRIQIQIGEMRSGVLNELEKWRGELGHLKQEINQIKKSSESLPL